MSAKIIELAAIQISPTRQRRTFDPARLNELKESIERNGLFHPLVLREENGALILVSGERRLRAIQDIWELGGSFRHDGGEMLEGHAPYVTLGELDELSREEAELDENIRRVDLTWQERAQASARLYALRSKQAEARGDPSPTSADISLEVRGLDRGTARQTTRRELLVARHLDDEEVAKAADLNEAWKKLQRKEEAERRVALAATVGLTYSADDHRLFNVPAEKWMREQAAGLFDVILTDPPYGMGADEFGDSGGLAAGAHGYADDWASVQPLLQCLLHEGFRIAKPEAHLYIFCDIDRFAWLRAEAAVAGWKPFRTPLVFHKPSGMRAPWPEHGPQRQYELILYAVKGQRRVTKLYGDVLTYRPDAQLNHSAQKPVELYIDLLRRSCAAGDSVLDPFCGTGTIFPAAQELKLFATGVERDPASYGTSLQRLEALRDGEA